MKKVGHTSRRVILHQNVLWEWNGGNFLCGPIHVLEDKVVMS